MSRRETVYVNGETFELQSVSPKWYYDTNDRCGMSGSGNRDTQKYIDMMLRNVVVSPAEIAARGLDYFESKEDIETPELLIKEIERFLRPGAQYGSRNGGGEKQ